MEDLDEAAYRVQLIDARDTEANRGFDERVSVADAKRRASAWQAMFRMKLCRSGVRLDPGSAVLDCCCGLGYFGEMLQHEWSAKVAFCDLSDAQLRTLKARLASGGLANMPVSQADLLHLPHPNETFDLVAGNSFLHHLADVPAALAELHRVLRPEGKILLLHEPGLTADYWESFPWSLVKDTTTSDASGFTDLWMFTPDDLRRLLLTMGFRDIHIFGCGMVPAVIINWYSLVAARLGRAPHILQRIAQAIRVASTSFDLRFGAEWKLRASPSLMVVAMKVENS